MNIKTRYNIGQHIWVVYKNKGEVCIYDDYIGWISYENSLVYGLRESCNEIKEEDIILYEETEKLVEEIQKLMKKIRDKEEN